MNKNNLLGAFALILASASALHAQVQIVTSQFTDSLTYSVSNTDLLQTNLSSATISPSGYSGALGGGTSISRLNDGNFGNSRSDYSAAVAFASGAIVTFNFDLTTNTAGYNITSVSTFVGWDNGRDGQEYTVSYSLASAPATFITLAVVPQLAAGDGDGYPTSRTSVTIQDLGGDANLLNGVAALQFTFTDFENGGSAYREIDVIGSAVASAIPEPSTYAAMAGVMSLGFAAWRRSRGSKAASA
ncbi:PEP-CTERM sorting domain-containing protein [Oleiharenicola lentus]|uniref:PEP-CTERM sorting domain-containing protein n=1 Tax=Oleiharenicola lentus TaxID=2508720 RepID=UPI003F66BED6